MHNPQIYTFKSFPVTLCSDSEFTFLCLFFHAEVPPVFWCRRFCRSNKDQQSLCIDTQSYICKLKLLIYLTSVSLLLWWSYENTPVRKSWYYLNLDRNTSMMMASASTHSFECMLICLCKIRPDFYSNCRCAVRSNLVEFSVMLFNKRKENGTYSVLWMVHNLIPCF